MRGRVECRYRIWESVETAVRGFAQPPKKLCVPSCPTTSSDAFKRSSTGKGIRWWTSRIGRGAAVGSLLVRSKLEPRETAAAGTDLSIVDMQVGSMGGMAITRTLKAMTPATGPIVLLLDRQADAFIARRAGADAWLAKPFNAQALRRVLADVTPVGATS